MNFFRLYIGDYLRDTGTLTLAQHGAYILMLLEHYATERPLPTGRELHRLLRAASKSEREAVDWVADKFWSLTDHGLVNARSAKEFARLDEISDTNRAIALSREAQKRARTVHEACFERAESVPRNEHETSTYQTPDTRHQKEKEKKTAARKRATPPEKPADLSDQVWKDWLQLRSSKRAPVTETVLRGAKAEALKAGMSLEEFLGVWCRRGSQGLEAAWIKPAERVNGHDSEPEWRREQRERNEAALGPFAARKRALVVVDGSDGDGPPKLLG